MLPKYIWRVKKKGSMAGCQIRSQLMSFFFENHNSFEKSFDSVTVFDNYAVYSAINSFEQTEIFLSDLKRVWGNP